MPTGNPTAPAPAPVVPGSPEADAAAAAKFDAAGGQAGTEAPAVVPAPVVVPPAAVVPPVVPPVVTPPVVPGALDFDAFAKEFTDTGALSEATYKALETAGIPKAVADAYVNGLQATSALAAQEEAKLFEVVGGKDKFPALQQWMQGNLTAAELKAFNDSTVDGTFDQAKLAMEAVNARYVAAMGGGPGLREGTGGSSATVGGYESLRQFVEATKDPRYAKDPAFRQAHERKIAATAPGII